MSMDASEGIFSILCAMALFCGAIVFFFMLKNRKFMLKKGKIACVAGFSLLEIAIGLSIVGIMSSFVMRGRHMLDVVKLRSIGQQVQSFRIAVQMYVEQEGRLPSSQTFWKDLSDANCFDLPPDEEQPSSRLGGRFSVATEKHPGIWLALMDEHKNGVVKYQEAQQIDRGIDNGNPDSGDVRYEKDQNGMCVMFFRIW